MRAAEIESPAPRGHYLREFGQSDREMIENSNSDASVPQALALMNGTCIDADDLGLNLVPEVGADGTVTVASLQDHLDAVERKAIGEALAQWVHHGQSQVPLAAFSIERFTSELVKT